MMFWVISIYLFISISALILVIIDERGRRGFITIGDFIKALVYSFTPLLNIICLYIGLYELIRKSGILNRRLF